MLREVHLCRVLGQYPAMLIPKGLIPRLEIWELRIAHAQAIPPRFIHVGGAYTLEGRPHAILPFSLLCGRIQGSMRWEYEVGLARDVERRVQIDARSLQHAHLLAEYDGIYHHTIPDDVHRARAKNPAGDGVQHVALTLHL